MKKDILGYQMNPEGDRKDIYHILRESGVNPNRLVVVDILEPIPTEIPPTKRIILTGSTLTLSEQMSDELKIRTERIGDDVLHQINSGILALGICYGSQIMAQKLWPGSVQPTGKWNVGRTKIIPTQENTVFGGSLEPMAITISFKDNIVGIPKKNILAKSPIGEILAYQYKSFIGILGHPEIPVNIIQKVIEQRKDDARYQNINVLSLSEHDEMVLPSSIRIIQNFLTL